MDKIIFVLIFAMIPGASFADMIIGEETVYQIVKGDTIELISAKLGIEKKIIINENNMDVKKHLMPGQELRVNTRTIVPRNTENGIIINIPEKMLYFFMDGKLEMAFPVGLGMASPKWRTPVEEFTVIKKEKNPTWYVPESIQEEMAAKNEPVKTIVPPGPDNPLGKYAVKTSIPGILIHETIWPNTVNQFRSHGCIRVIPANMEKFFNEVEIDTPGELIYEPIKIALSDGKVYLEAHKDIYSRVKDLGTEAVRIIEEKEAVDKVDWDKVESVVNEKSGIAEDVTLR